MPTSREKSWLVANAALAGAWLFLHARVVGWLGARFVGSPLHAGIVLAAAGLLLRRARPGELLAALARPPGRAPGPIALIAGAAIALAVCERRLGTSTLSAILAGLGAYGLAGLYLDGARFRRALPAALLLTFLLPFGEQADTYFGFAARAFSARAAAGLLAALGKPAVRVETLLVLDNGIAHVDVPCSGARSLWTGLIFFLAATCLLGRRPGARWLFAGLAHLALLVAENVVRVAVVVLLAVALDLPRVAEILHAPLGVLGFALACALTLSVLRRFVPAPAPSPAAPPATPAPPAFAPAMAAALLVLSIRARAKGSARGHRAVPPRSRPGYRGGSAPAQRRRGRPLPPLGRLCREAALPRRRRRGIGPRRLQPELSRAPRARDLPVGERRARRRPARGRPRGG